MQLTPSQAKALSTERHLAITANAGSGKTRILVERYVNLFASRPDLSVRNVVAITFTENAGAELRTRILEEVKKRLAILPETDEQRFRLIKLRDGLPSAFIGTIHSFASRLLRAYPVEAGVDAGFTLLTGADQRIILDEAISRVFYSALSEAYEASEVPSVLHLFRTLGRGTVTNLIRALLQNRTRSANIQKLLLTKADGVILEILQQDFERILAYCGEVSTDSFLRDLTAFVKPGKSGQEALPFFSAYLNAESRFDKIRAFAQLADKIVTDKGTLNSLRIELKQLPERLSIEATEFISSFEALEPLLNTVPGTIEEFRKEHHQYLSLVRATFELYDAVSIEYQISKNNFGLLDFDDLIERLGKLLADTRVCDELVAQFQFIMIDEYQDTDESQFELAKLLTENFGSRNNLTIVGDPKQSIYTFRNADASVFQSTQNAIRAQSLSNCSKQESELMGLTISEERGEIALRESFRMASAPLAMINHLFTAIMGKSDAGILQSQNPPYSDLVLGRSSQLPGGVEWICPNAIEQSKQDAPSGSENEFEDASEVELIARKIVQMVQPEYGYKLDQKSAIQVADYDDIAILLRSRASLPLLEKALRECGIPYSVAKGAGFYSQQEILDISSYLAFLLTPSNDIALAGILRSPFFALSDVELYQSAVSPALDTSERESQTFWDRFGRFAESAENQHLARVLEQLTENRVLTGRTSAAYLIEKIYAETGIYATLAAAPNGQQKVANLEKFLAQARHSDASGFSGLDDFVERIQYLIDQEEQESQADFAVESGAVRIMTIHSAKGLEFPIVFVPVLQKKFKFDTSAILDKDYGLHISLPDSDRPPFLAELIRLRSKLNTVAEEKRIFYVATTRAKDHLVLSSTLPPKVQKDTWLGWVAAALPEVLDLEASSTTLSVAISRYDSETRRTIEENLTLTIPLIRTIDDIVLHYREPRQFGKEEIGPYHLAALPLLRQRSRFSATQLLRFKECPTKYQLSYGLGMPDEPKFAFDPEADDSSERVKGDSLGQLVHNLLDKIGKFTVNGILDQAAFNDELEHILFDLQISDNDLRSKYSDMAQSHVQRFLSSELAPLVLSSSESHSEYKLQATFGAGDILYGIIDRLYRDDFGRWTILDYKTERTTDPGRRAEGLLRYQFQLCFYAYLVHLLDPSETSIHATLFFTATGEDVRFTFSQVDFEWLKDEVATLIAAIRTAESARGLNEMKRNTNHCPNCHFFDTSRKACIVLALESLETNSNSGKISQLA